MTRAQRAALERHWARYGVACHGPLDLDRLFGRRAERVCEIGFGSGDVLLELARSAPERDYLGIEVHDPGIGRLLARLAAEGLDNVRVARGDAVDVLERCLAPASLDAVLCLFPDPWPKKRHRKRRLVRPAFVALLASRIAAGGTLRLATDDEDYARQMLEVVEADGRFVNCAGPGAFAARLAGRPRTRFETRGEGLGHRLRELAFVRAPRRAPP